MAQALSEPLRGAVRELPDEQPPLAGASAWSGSPPGEGNRPSSLICRSLSVCFVDSVCSILAGTAGAVLQTRDIES